MLSIKDAQEMRVELLANIDAYNALAKAFALEPINVGRTAEPVEGSKEKSYAEEKAEIEEIFEGKKFSSHQDFEAFVKSLGGTISDTHYNTGRIGRVVVKKIYTGAVSVE